MNSSPVAIIVAFVLGAAIASGAFLLLDGDDDSGAPSNVLDTESIERSIEDSIQKERDVEAQVSCPDGIQIQTGLKFRCEATTKDGVNAVIVTQKPGAQVTWVVK